MKKKKRNFTTLILVVILLAGLSLLLYPTVSDYWNSLHASQVISDYAEQVSDLDTDRYAEMWEDARAFNEELLERTNTYMLTEEQAAALREVEALSPGQTALLYGVTGSGKTEVYLRCIEACLQQGKGAIVLVPEIALTPQTVGRFAARFGDRIAVLHSRLSAGEFCADVSRDLVDVREVILCAGNDRFGHCNNVAIPRGQTIILDGV